MIGDYMKVTLKYGVHKSGNEFKLPGDVFEITENTFLAHPGKFDLASVEVEEAPIEVELSPTKPVRRGRPKKKEPGVG